ncbi:MAG: 2-amino-4-hydroxy-6-hydroxymethyldihydropteridine diphosphokinase [Gammaproteobacteria bacterium]
MLSLHEKRSVVAYIGLGSNLDDPVQQIRMARVAIAGLNGVEELAFSSLYSSPPMGPQDQPNYINAVMAVQTELTAFDLLHCLQRIELNQGRVREGLRWGARTLDLDLLLYADQQISEPDLQVPHPGMSERAFVLYPLHEIAPNLIIPGKGGVADLVVRCPSDGLHRLG